MRGWLRVVAGLAGAALFLRGGGAGAQPAAPKQVVRFDAKGLFFEDHLPHGKPFLIEINTPHQITRAYLWEDRSGCGVLPKQAITAISTSVRDGAPIVKISIEDPLSLDTAYCFVVAGSRGLEAGERRLIERAFEAVLDAQVGAPRRGDADRAATVAQALGAFGAMRTASGELIEDVIAQKINTSDELLDAWEAAKDLVEAGAKVGQLWDRLALRPGPTIEAAFGARPPVELTAAIAAHARLAAAPRPGAIVSLDGLSATWTTEAAPLRQALETLATSAEVAALSLCGSPPTLAVAVQAAQQAIDAARADLAAAVAGAQAKLDQALAQHAQAVARQAWCEALINEGAIARLIIGHFEDARRQGDRLLSARASMLAKLSAEVGAFDLELAVTASAKRATYTERAGLYISADLGVLMPVFLSPAGGTGGISFATYLGFNVYLGAVDKEVPLGIEDGFRKRFSLVFGLTLDGISDDARTVEGVLGSSALVTGVGLRLSDYVRLGAGAVWFRQLPSNPSVTDKPIRATPYFALSLDFDVAGALSATVGKKR